MSADEYDLDDPKHPDYAERMSSRADDRRDEQQTGGE